VLTLLGKLMNEEEKPFMFCCKCFADCHDSSSCSFCSKWMCDACIRKLLSCCADAQARIDKDYGPEINN
jgi:hypothetical protein